MLGSSGRLGQVLRRAWPRDGPAVVWHDRDTGFDILADRPALRRAVLANDVVMLFAGATPATGQDLDLNIRLAAATLAVAADKPIFLASSAAVYGKPQGICREEDQVSPLSVYGKSKLAMERFGQQHPGRVINLRIGNVVGADTIFGNAAFSNPKRVVQLDRFADGRTPLRSYVGPHLLARILLRLVTLEYLTGDLPSVLNIAAPKPVEMGHLLDADARDWCARTPDDNAIAQVVLDTSRLEKLFEFTATDSQPDAMVADWHGTQ